MPSKLCHATFFSLSPSVTSISPYTSTPHTHFLPFSQNHPLWIHTLSLFSSLPSTVALPDVWSMWGGNCRSRSFVFNILTLESVLVIHYFITHYHTLRSLNIWNKGIWMKIKWEYLKSKYFIMFKEHEDQMGGVLMEPRKWSSWAWIKRKLQSMSAGWRRWSAGNSVWVIQSTITTHTVVSGLPSHMS